MYTILGFTQPELASGALENASTWILQEPPQAGRASPVERGGAGSRGSGRFLHGLLLIVGGHGQGG